jgi:hypothetical protein
MQAIVNDNPTLEDVKAILGEGNGHHPILTYVQEREKHPRLRGWQKVNYQQSQARHYQVLLRQHANTGVLLGNENLCTIDCDTDLLMSELIRLDPVLAETLTSHGERAGQFWLYIEGERPRKIEYLFVNPASPLAKGAKIDEKTGLAKIGEFRAEGGQSIIRGVHPCGNIYRWPCAKAPITITLADIVWPEEIILPWARKAAGTKRHTENQDDNDLLRRAIERVSVAWLWNHFGYPPRCTNPVKSPWREDRNPSFSVYDEGRLFKDHGNGESGDSFDFYQRSLKLDARDAFVGFVELAGLGHELQKNRVSDNGAQTPVYQDGLSALVEKLNIYYDPAAGCYWRPNNRGQWIRGITMDVERQLKALGYSDAKKRGGPLSEVERIMVEIQLEHDVQYAGPLAGHRRGVLYFGEKRILVVDSPCLIQPANIPWPNLKAFMGNLLGPEQLAYFDGWMQIAIQTLHNEKMRPGQAVVFAGEKDCGKSLLQSLITLLIGGRIERPYPYMSGATSFNGNLFGAEHLAMEDEQPSTDIRARRNFGSKVKEITAIEYQNCHAKYRHALSLPVFWRLTVSVNDESENLMVLPILDDSIMDKLMLFKVQKYPMPMRTASMEERERFWQTLVGELPGYLDYVLNAYEIPSELVSQRYGITHYHHPELIKQLLDLAPEMRLFNLIDAEIFKEVFPALEYDQWYGTALKLEQRLTDSTSSVQYQARELLSWQGACGTYLGRLRKLFPKRFAYEPKRDQRRWIIQPPSTEQETPENEPF